MRLTKLNTKNFDEFKILLLNGKTNLSELFRVINVFRLKNLLLFFKFFMWIFKIKNDLWKKKLTTMIKKT